MTKSVSAIQRHQILLAAKPLGIALLLLGLLLVTLGINSTTSSTPSLFVDLNNLRFAQALGNDAAVHQTRVDELVAAASWFLATGLILSVLGVVLALVSWKRKLPALGLVTSQVVSAFLFVAFAIALITAGTSFADEQLEAQHDAQSLLTETASARDDAQVRFDLSQQNTIKASEALTASPYYAECNQDRYSWNKPTVDCTSWDYLKQDSLDAAANQLQFQTDLKDAENLLTMVSPLSSDLNSQAALIEPIRIGTVAFGGLALLLALGLLFLGIRNAIRKRAELRTIIHIPNVAKAATKGPSTKRCPKCDEKIRESATICKHCGSDLS